jgi:hypothetical protein
LSAEIAAVPFARAPRAKPSRLTPRHQSETAEPGRELSATRQHTTDLTPDCSHANDRAHLLKKAGAPLRFLVRQPPGRKVEILGGASRRCTERGHLHPPVFNTLQQQPLFRGFGLGRICETQRAEQLEAKLGVLVIRHVHEFLDEVWMASHLGFSQANGVLAYPRLRVIKRRLQQVLV